MKITKIALLALCMATILAGCELRFHEKIDLDFHAVYGLNEDEQILQRDQVKTHTINLYKNDLES